MIILSLLLGSTACGHVREVDRAEQYGQYSEVQRLLESEMSRRKLSNNDLVKLCEAYSFLKNYSKLFSCLDETERRILGGDRYAYAVDDLAEHSMTIAILRHDDAVRESYRVDISTIPARLRAAAFVELGDYSRAVSESEKFHALKQKEEDPPIFKLMRKEYIPLNRNYGMLEPLKLLAFSHALHGNQKKAREVLDHIGTLDMPPVPSVRNEKRLVLARGYLSLGDYARVYESLRSLEKRELSGGSQESRESGFNLTAEVIERDFIMAKCLYETGRMAVAKPAYDALIGRPELKELGDLYWVALYDRGRIAEQEGSVKHGIVFYKQAIDVIERQRSTINTEASRIGFVGNKQAVYHRLVAALMADGQPAQAFEYVERAKARALVDLLASKQDFSAPAGAPSVQVATLVKEWDQADGDARVPVASSEESSRRSARGVQIKANIQAASPELASLVMVTETASGAIQALLEPVETLLEYYYQGADLYAFVVTRDRVQGIKLNGANVAKDVEAFRTAVEDPKSDRAKEWSRNLYARLIQPVAAQVTTKQLLIVGHGVLHYLPFAALSDGTGYLVDRYSIRLLPSASVLQFLKGRPAHQGGRLLAFGNPDLGDAQYDLKFAQEEVQAIAKTFPQAKVLVRQEATKGAFTSLGPQFSYLHLATHGKFDPDAPLKSGLLLAKDAQGEGFLSLGDLYSLRLNADLVTLSACETGLGKISNGDDVVGLTRGFLYAGSSSIVASLWQVDDRATSLLMTEFYANLKKTDKREALRQAQLTIKQRYPHPFYWAAFQLTGKPD